MQVGCRQNTDRNSKLSAMTGYSQRAHKRFYYELGGSRVSAFISERFYSNSNIQSLDSSKISNPRQESHVAIPMTVSGVCLVRLSVS